MAITAVNGVTQDKNRYMTTFTGKKKTQKNVNYNQQNGLGSTALKSAPIIVLLAMNPATLNSDIPNKYMPLNAQELTEVVAPIPTNNISTVDIRNIRPDQPITPKQVLPGALNDKYVQYKRPFKMDGKDYMLYFINLNKGEKGKDDLVTDIFLVPDDYSLIRLYGENKNYPPSLKKFTYHDLGDPENKDYCTAVLHERRCDKDGKNSRFIDYEVRLPNDIANDIINLASGESDLLMVDRMASMFSMVEENN